MKRMFLLGLMSISLASCATVGGTLNNGSELYGKTVRIEGAAGTSRTTFNRDGTAMTVWSNGKRVTARYWVENGQLCFASPGGSDRSCWVYTGRLVPGRTVDATAPNGDAVRVTLE
jgi:ribosomal protein L35AE/L33A